MVAKLLWALKSYIYYTSMQDNIRNSGYVRQGWVHRVGTQQSDVWTETKRFGDSHQKPSDLVGGDMLMKPQKKG